MSLEPETTDWHLSDFDFELPEERIAAHPVTPRDRARLLHVRKDALIDRIVSDLPHILREGDLLVLNDTKVIPARLNGMRGIVRIEALLHKRDKDGTWLALAKPGKRLKEGDQIVFAPDFTAEVTKKYESGEIRLRFAVPDELFFTYLERHGHVPLPPYIKRPEGDTPSDKENYQTIFAAREGAVAAPTAGLHFTPELLGSLVAKGIDQVKITLHVGAGTFLPVKVDNIREHQMHAEYGEISAEAAAQINKAKAEGRRIVAVGTTALRVLESAADEAGVVHPFAQETSIFIYPGYKFKAVNALMTNFHLPKSTLFMLVAAFSGLETMRAAYAHAVQNNYRFFSYGDTTFLDTQALPPCGEG